MNTKKKTKKKSWKIEYAILERKHEELKEEFNKLQNPTSKEQNPEDEGEELNLDTSQKVKVLVKKTEKAQQRALNEQINTLQIKEAEIKREKPKEEKKEEFKFKCPECEKEFNELNGSCCPFCNEELE